MKELGPGTHLSRKVLKFCVFGWYYHRILSTGSQETAWNVFLFGILYFPSSQPSKIKSLRASPSCVALWQVFFLGFVGEDIKRAFIFVRRMICLFCRWISISRNSCYIKLPNGIFGKLRCLKMSWLLVPLFYAELLQEYETNLDPFQTHIILEISKYWKPYIWKMCDPKLW